MPDTLQSNALQFGNTGPQTTQTTGTFGREHSAYGDMILEIYTRQNIYASIVSQQESQIIPGNSGSDEVQWWRFPELGEAGSLTEGTTPNADSMKRDRVRKRLGQYGKWLQLTDLEMNRTSLSISSAVLQRLAISYMQTMDTLNRDSLYLTTAPASADFPSAAQGGNVKTDNDLGNTITNVTRGGGAATYGDLTSDNANFTLANIRAMVKSLEDKNVPMLLPRVFASTNVGTLPGDPAYIGVTDGVGRAILRGLTSGTGADARFKFEEAKTYANNTPLMMGEFGRTGEVRWLWSTKTSWEGTGVTKGKGRRLAIVGRDAFANVTASNENMNVYVKSAAQTGVSDPLQQRNSIGMKFSGAASLINPAHCAVLFYATA